MAKGGNARIERIKEVGHGGFGVVYFGKYDGKTEVAIKVIRGGLPAEVLEEASMLKRLNHRNIIRYIDIIQTWNEISLIMEFIEGNNLRDYIAGRAPSMDYWRTTRHIMTGVAHGMWYLHDQNVVHADLKSLNVLLRPNYEAVICDFGLAKTIIDSKTVVTNAVAGTELWFAPELCLAQPERSSFASDVWAYGCILLEITSQKYPWIDDYSSSRLLLNALANARNAHIFESICQRQRAPKKLIDLKSRCCAWKKKQRPDFTAIVQEISAITDQDLADISQPDNGSTPSNPSNPKPRVGKQKLDTPASLPSFPATTVPTLVYQAASTPTAHSLDNPKPARKPSAKAPANPPKENPVIKDKIFGTLNGRTYYQGPGGGVYYLTEGGKKEYAPEGSLPGFR